MVFSKVQNYMISKLKHSPVRKQPNQTDFFASTPVIASSSVCVEAAQW